jgi:two-component system sensor histidine kinase PilS (NtrC family)
MEVAVGVRADFEVRLKRLMFFRVVMVTTLLLIAAYVEAISESLAPVNPLYFLVAATYVLTVGHALAVRYVRPIVPQVYAQVVGDLVVITGLVYIYGIRTGFTLLYPLSVLSGSVLLRRRGGMVVASLATLLYGGALWAVWSGVVPPQGLAEVLYLPPRGVVYSVFVTAVTCGSVALIGAYFSENLRHVGERLELVVGQVADLQGLNDVIVNSIQSGLLTEDADGRILWVNPLGEGILGLSSASVRGRGSSQVFGSSLLELSAVRARASSRSLARLEIPYHRPDGTALALGLSVAPLTAGSQMAGGHLLVFQDLTDVKRLEEDVRTKEKLAAVGEMAAQLAHEIRNPLGSISGSAQMLMGEPNMSPEQEHLLGIITRESRRLSDTLNRFLLHVRPSGHGLGPADLRPLIAEAVTLLRNGPEVGEKHVVDFEADDGPHVCLADRDQITQVFWNLARNGLEAMPDGGRLQVRLRCDGDELVLSVRDQGHGMGGDDQRRMFEPFHSGSTMGTGLGLAIVFRIVKEHRGDISVRTMAGRGTQVDVRLPVVAVPVLAR